MKLSIDSILNAGDPWDFSIVVDGAEYRTRRPSIGEIGLFGNSAAIPSHMLPELIQSLFYDEAPDVSKWSIEQAMAFIGGYSAYFQRKTSTEKKLGAVLAAAQAAVNNV